MRGKKDDPEACPSCENAIWLLDSGEWVERIAERVGLTAATIEDHLRRHGHSDYAQIVSRERRRVMADA